MIFPGDDTAAQVLRAAAAEFAEKGYSGARVEAIARRAGVNKATLYYQVGDKTALYGLVMERVVGALADKVETAIAAGSDPRDQLRRYILAFGDDQALLRLAAPMMMREVASGGRTLPDAALAQMGRIVGSVRRVLEAGRKAGVLRASNPMIVHMMVIGSLLFYVAGSPIRARVAREQRREFGPEEFVSTEAAAAAVAEIVVASLANPTTTT